MPAFKYQTSNGDSGSVDAANESEAMDALLSKFPEASEVQGLDDMDADEDQALFVDLPEDEPYLDAEQMAGEAAMAGEDY